MLQLAFSAPFACKIYFTDSFFPLTSHASKSLYDRWSLGPYENEIEK